MPGQRVHPAGLGDPVVAALGGAGRGPAVRPAEQGEPGDGRAGRQAEPAGHVEHGQRPVAQAGGEPPGQGSSTGAGSSCGPQRGEPCVARRQPQPDARPVARPGRPVQQVVVHLHDQLGAGLQQVAGAGRGALLAAAARRPGRHPVVAERAGRVVAADAGAAEAGPALAGVARVELPRGRDVGRRDPEEDRVVDDVDVARPELAAGQERRPPQAGVDEEAAVLVGPAVRRPRRVRPRHGQGGEPLADPQRGARPGRRGVPVRARGRRGARRGRARPGRRGRRAAGGRAAAQEREHRPGRRQSPPSHALQYARRPDRTVPAWVRPARRRGTMEAWRSFGSPWPRWTRPSATSPATRGPSLTWSRAAADDGADLVLFPEMALTGYPPEDLVFRESFRSASVRARDELAGRLAEAGLGELAVVVGYLDSDGGPRNACAVLLRAAEVAATYFKHHLPNYGVFDEARYFVPGDRFVVVRLRGVDVALTICEDLWQDGGPFAVAARAEVGLVGCINGSPYERNKDDVRLPLAAAGRPRPARPSRTSTWSAPRTSWSTTATR